MEPANFSRARKKEPEAGAFGGGALAEFCLDLAEKRELWSRKKPGVKRAAAALNLKKHVKPFPCLVLKVPFFAGFFKDTKLKAGYSCSSGRASGPRKRLGPRHDAARLGRFRLIFSLASAEAYAGEVHQSLATT